MKFHSIKTQLIIVYTILISILIVSISFAVSFISSHALWTKTVTSAERELALINEKLDLFSAKLETESLYLIKMQDEFSSDDPYQKFLYTSGILSFLQDFIFTQASVESISYYDTNSNMFFSNGASSFQQKYEPINYIESFKAENATTKWLGFHYSESNNLSQSPEWVCTFLRKMYSYDGNFLGIWELNVSERTIHSIYETAIADHYNIYILDHTNHIVSCSDIAQLHISLDDLGQIMPPSSNSYLYSDSEFLYTTDINEQFGWTLVSTLPLEVLLKESRNLIKSIYFIGLLTILLAILLLNFITHFVTKPLKELTRTVEKIAQGNYSIHADITSQNEIGQLAQRVNSMADNTLNLLHQIEKEETLKRQFEFSYIQSQMNPHFLYNTLENICGMIAVDEKRNAIKMIQNVSSFYRKVLSKGIPIITIEQELEITRCYLDILRQRYKGIYTYEIQIEPETSSYKIPKLTLQPIVENALIHGILPTGMPGRLSINVHAENARIILSVTDTGQGMDLDTLTRIRALIKEDIFPTDTDSGFGIIGALRRLRVFLNTDSVDIEIDSVPLEGTRIRLFLPQNTTLFKEEFYSNDI